MEQKLNILQKSYDELLNKELDKSLQEKEQELEELKKKFDKQKYITEDLLKVVGELTPPPGCSETISSNNHIYEEMKNTNIGRLKAEGFKEKDIDKLCELQRDITQLKIKLEDLKPKEKLMIEGSEPKNLLEYPIFSQHLTIKIKDFLQTKQDFLTARKKTIEELQKCVNELEGKLDKQEIINLAGNGIGNVGGSITDVITFGIPRAIGETIVASNNFLKTKFTRKSSKEFHFSLGNEEKELNQLNEAYNSLINLIKSKPKLEISSVIEIFNFKLKSKEVRLFDTHYKVLDVLADDGI